MTHLHGAVGVGDESDGYAEAWYLPAANNIPAGYATEGTWYDFFEGKASAAYGVTLGSRASPPSSTRTTSASRRSGTTTTRLGMTRLNVYAGPAGFFLVRGGPQGDKAILDSRTGTAAVLPGPAPREGDKFPPNKTYYEIPIAIQDRAFNEDGSLFYPDSREFFDGATAQDPGFIPDTDLSPIWNPEFFGNMIMVNGNTWPFQVVEQRRYRLRFLNGCQSRFLILDFADIPGVEVWAIGNEGGFLAAPVNLTADHDNQLLMGLAERADLIVDFTNVPAGELRPAECRTRRAVRRRRARRATSMRADPATTGQVLQFQVVPAVAPGPDDSAAVPGPAAHHPAARRHQHAPPGARRDGVGRLGRAGRGDARHGGRPGGSRNTGCGRTRSPRTRPSATPRSGSSTTSPPTPTPCTSTRRRSRWSTGRPW